MNLLLQYKLDDLEADKFLLLAESAMEMAMVEEDMFLEEEAKKANTFLKRFVQKVKDMFENLKKIIKNCFAKLRGKKIPKDVAAKIDKEISQAERTARYLESIGLNDSAASFRKLEQMDKELTRMNQEAEARAAKATTKKEMKKYQDTEDMMRKLEKLTEEASVELNQVFTDIDKVDSNEKFLKKKAEILKKLNKQYERMAKEIMRAAKHDKVEGERLNYALNAGKEGAKMLDNLTSADVSLKRRQDAIDNKRYAETGL